MGDVAGVYLPGAVGEFAERGELGNDLLRGSGKRGGDFCGFFRVLGVSGQGECQGSDGQEGSEGVETKLSRARSGKFDCEIYHRVKNPYWHGNWWGCGGGGWWESVFAPGHGGRTAEGGAAERLGSLLDIF